MQLMHFVEDLGVQIIGGCCGTRSDHIQQLAELSQDLMPKERLVGERQQLPPYGELPYMPAAASIYSPQH